MISGEAGTTVLDPDSDIGEWLDETEYRDHRLWAYGQTKRELILEERIGSTGSFPEDLKFFVFDGEVQMIQVDHGRGMTHTRNLYTSAWEPLPWVFSHPKGVVTPVPTNLREMVQIASKLGKDFDFVRVDLYNVDDVIYFGELTVYPAAGLSAWPRQLDLLIGDTWSLPEKKILQS